MFSTFLTFFSISVINLLDKSIVEEKFQVRIFNATKIKKLGEKVLKVTMKSESGDSGKADDGPKSQLFKVDHFQDLNQQQPVPSAYQSTIDMAHRLPNQYFNYIALVICLLLLMVPHDDTSNSAFQLIQINVNVKLVVSFLQLKLNSRISIYNFIQTRPLIFLG